MSRPPSPAASTSAARRSAAARLAAAGVDSPELDARLLVEAATGRDAAALAADPGRSLTTEEAARLEALLARRLAREPMSHILGRAGFWTLELQVTADVLSPRPESETLIEAALAETAGQPSGLVLDLGVGPGTLLFAFLAERRGWRGVGVDASEAALAIARRNADALSFRDRTMLVRGDWDAPLAPCRAFDLVLSNPPYIASADIAALEPEVARYEPRLALDGGAGGLDAYRRIAPALPRLLRRGGVAVLEIGATQAAAVAALLVAADRSAHVRVARDLGGRDRAVVGRLQA